MAGQVLPLGPVRFVVYATDAGGVGRIELKVNGVLLPAARAVSAIRPQSRAAATGPAVDAGQRRQVHPRGARDRRRRRLRRAGLRRLLCRRLPAGGDARPPPPRLAHSFAGPRPARPLQVAFTADRPAAARRVRHAAVERHRRGPRRRSTGRRCPSSPGGRSARRRPALHPGRHRRRRRQLARELTLSVAEADTPTPLAAPPSSTPVIPPTATMTPFPVTLPAPPPPPADIRLWADNDVVAAGSCTMIRWHVSERQGVLGGRAARRGRRREQPGVSLPDGDAYPARGEDGRFAAGCP